MSDDRPETITDTDQPGEPLRFHPGEGGRHTPPVVDAGGYIRSIRAAFTNVCGTGTPGLVCQQYVDRPDIDPHFAVVPLFGLTQAQAIALAKQWHADVCDALGVDLEPLPARPPTLASTLFEGWAEVADRDRDGQPTDPGPDDPGGGVA